MKKEKERIICAIPKEDNYHDAVNTDEKSPAGQGECDLQAELSEKAAGQPEAEDCSIDIIPDVTKPGAVPTGSWEKSEGAIKNTCGRLLVPDVISMTKYLCSNHRLIIYSYLNQCLKDGSLAKTAKLDIRDINIERQSLLMHDIFEKMLSISPARSSSKAASRLPRSDWHVGFPIRATSAVSSGSIWDAHRRFSVRIIHD